jgi:heptosyltransferase I
MAALDLQKKTRNVERKVLILKPSALGDIVMALPAARNIKRGLPGAKVSWLVNKGLAGILEGNPHVDEVIEFDRETFGAMWRNASALKEFGGLVGRLRKEKFDVVLDLQGLLRTALLARLSGCKVRIGMKDAREGAPFFYTDLVGKPEGTEHVTDFYNELAELLWVDGGKPVFDFGANKKAEESARAVLRNEGVSGEYAVIVAGASDAGKRWPVERFAAIADELAQETGLTIVATGSKADAEVTAKLVAAAKTKIANLAGKTSVAELAAVIKGSRLVVGNDTGPTHIGAAMGLPVVVIFGKVNPARLYPYGRKECVAAVDSWSRPKGIRCDEARYGVENVTVEMVRECVKVQTKDLKRPVQ